jgi:hypothetical protein
MTRRCHGRVVFGAVFAFILVAGSLWGGEPFRYPQGRFEQAELQYVNGLPVLRVAGTPAEIGRQEAMLTRVAGQRLLDYPKDLFTSISSAERWPQLLKLGQLLLPQFPPDHLAELEAYAAAARIDRNALIGANTMTDTYRGGFGCSSLIVEPNRSDTKSPLFGRNLDFFTLGWLQEYSLVTVYRPAGKHAFVSIGFPGLLGCLSGMNDAGLALATHEVFMSGDGAPLLNPHGTPYTLVFRRILEQCATIAEAEQLLRSLPRTTLQSLAVCDRQQACVLEITPQNVVRRDSENGILACTNHFRTKPLRTLAFCRRYPKLVKAEQMRVLGLAEIATKLNEVNAGPMTLQTMIFEPGPLRLHLAIASCPSSALPLKTLDLAPLFAAPADSDRASAQRTGVSVIQ